MLKPKKKITSKEIQRDPFLETIDKAQAHLEQSRSSYVKIGIGIIVVIIAFNIYSDKNSQNNSSADASLGRALVALSLDDTENAKFQFETIINEFSSTKSAKLAKYYLGKMKYDSGDYFEAQIDLGEFINSKAIDLLMPSAYLMLADISLQNDKIDDALDLLLEGKNSSDNIHNQRMIELEIVRINIMQGESGNSQIILEDILSSKNVTSSEKQIAEELLGKISG
tara:strand:- start:185 stop:859 length:675 start_codon:yes stop_codon:yes gene_type:complete